jgi:MraZ protein
LRKNLSPEAENTFVIVRGTDGCLFAYPKNEWLKVWKGLSSQPVTPDTTWFRRRLLDSLRESTLDGQGRITLTQKQRDSAGLGNEVTIIGSGEMLELWEPGAWATNMKSQESALSYSTAFYNVMQQVKKPDNG